MYRDKWFVEPKTELECALVEIIGHMTDEVERAVGAWRVADNDEICYLVAEWFPQLVPVDRMEVYRLMETWFYSPRGGAVILDNAKEEVVARIVSNHSLTLDEAIALVGDFDPESEEENVFIDGKGYYYDELELKERY